MSEQLRYPVGKYESPAESTPVLVNQWIEEIETFPAQLKELVEDLEPEQLTWRYRPDGWSIKQVVHHCADSHLNSLMRFKLALTEDHPTIRPYHEDRWAELPDSNKDDISDSLMILTGLHRRWVYLLHRLSNEQLERTFYHPEHDEDMTIEDTIGMYAWHCRHHLAHVKQAVESEGQYD